MAKLMRAALKVVVNKTERTLVLRSIMKGAKNTIVNEMAPGEMVGFFPQAEHETISIEIKADD